MGWLRSLESTHTERTDPPPPTPQETPKLRRWNGEEDSSKFTERKIPVRQRNKERVAS